MKNTLIFVSALMVSVGATAGDLDAYGRVVAAENSYAGGGDCHYETAPSAPREKSMGGSIVGGIAGALLGSQVGGGNGKMAATAAGAIVGSITGDRVSNDNSGQSQTTRICRSDYGQQHRIVYEFGGRQFDAVVPFDARVGDRIRLILNVSVARTQ